MHEPFFSDSNTFHLQIVMPSFIFSVGLFSSNPSFYLKNHSHVLLTFWSVSIAYFFGFFGISFIDPREIGEVISQPQSQSQSQDGGSGSSSSCDGGGMTKSPSVFAMNKLANEIDKPFGEGSALKVSSYQISI